MRLSEKRSLHHCSFKSEKISEPETSSSPPLEETLLPVQSFVAHTCTGRPVYELRSCQKRKSNRKMENGRIRILLERQLIILLQVMNNSDKINYLFKTNDQNKIGIFVKHTPKVFMRRKNWREFKSYESMNLKEEDWSKIRSLLTNSRLKFWNYRMKSINCLNDSRDLKDAESVNPGKIFHSNSVDSPLTSSKSL